jgi:hypothetical protein
MEASAGEELEDTPEFELPDGRRLRRTNRTVENSWIEQTVKVELIYYITEEDGSLQREVEAFSLRYFFRFEMIHLLERLGFRVCELYGDFDGNPMGEGAPEMVFVAEKS